jgi:hypothetical protein
MVQHVTNVIAEYQRKLTFRWSGGINSAIGLWGLIRPHVFFLLIHYLNLYLTAHRHECGILSARGTEFFCDGPLNPFACLTINIYIL